MYSSCSYVQVSIPKRVSAKVERPIGTLPKKLYRFQSLKGFQPKWNITDRLTLCGHSQVSIPKRVSAKVELDRPNGCDHSWYVSIPKRVSAKVELDALVFLQKSI